MLSEFQNRILSELYPDKILTVSEFKAKFGISIDDKDICRPLKANHLIKLAIYGDKESEVFLLEAGKALIESGKTMRREKVLHHIHEWINTIIAVLALLAALFK